MRFFNDTRGKGELAPAPNHATHLILYVVADNPIGESGYDPDSKKWIVRSPERQLIRDDALDYYDGEE
jgi:hypothetical protein